DFLDSLVTWTVTDDAGNSRVIVSAAAPGTGPNTQDFPPGAGQTWTKPAGVTFVQVVCVGAGGGGGGGLGNNSAVSGGGGGGGGCVSITTFLAATLGATETVNVGLGGTGGVGVVGTAGNNGGNGGITNFAGKIQ